MKRWRMFLAQRRLNEVILYCVLIDVVLGYILKKYQGPHTTLPLALLYLMNLVVILAVYRFWKVPVFEWDEDGFTLYGISPFKKDRGAWRDVEKAGFKSVEVRRGKTKEFLYIIYTTSRGMHGTGIVPMDVVGFRDRLKEEMEAFLKKNGVAPL